MEFFAFEWVSNPQVRLSPITLSALEMVPGIDNIVFLAILTHQLPPHPRPPGRTIGLTLAFLLLIGVFLIADGFGLKIPKGCLYFALVFSVLVEAMNHWMRKKQTPVWGKQT
jgi:predicted tellurium resistance membrane protein TerC